MIKRFCLVGLLALASCAVQEEIVEEPMVMEEEIAGKSPIDCTGEDDGIGGTGCEPVARMAHPWR